MKKAHEIVYKDMNVNVQIGQHKKVNKKEMYMFIVTALCTLYYFHSNIILFCYNMLCRKGSICIQVSTM